MDKLQGGFSVEISYIPSINFSMQQNHIPVIRKLLITNNGETDLRDVEIKIIPEPDFAVAWNKKTDLIRANETLDIGFVNLQISIKYLSELTEKITGTFAVLIIANDQVICRETH